MSFGDITHQSLTIEKGAKFDGRATQAPGSSGGQLVTIGENRAQEVSREANTAARVTSPSVLQPMRQAGN